MHGIVIIRYSLIASMPSGVRVQCMFFDCFQKFMNYYELRRSVANNCNMCSEWNALRWIKNLGFSWKREKKNTLFFHSDWGLLLKRNVPPVHLSTYANIPSGTNITWMCWFSNKNAIWSCRKFQFICKKKKIQLIFVVVAKFHIIPMEWFNLEYIQYTMMYALASTATTSVSWLQ